VHVLYYQLPILIILQCYPTELIQQCTPTVATVSSSPDWSTGATPTVFNTFFLLCMYFIISSQYWLFCNDYLLTQQCTPTVATVSSSPGWSTGATPTGFWHFFTVRVLYYQHLILMILRCYATDRAVYSYCCQSAVLVGLLAPHQQDSRPFLNYSS